MGSTHLAAATPLNENMILEQTQKSDPKPGKLKDYEYYMAVAVRLAKLDPKLPFAALVVDITSGKILCATSKLNAKNTTSTWSGETSAIDNCLKKYPKLDWQNTALVSTAEPDILGQAVIVTKNIPLVVYGTPISYLLSQNWQVIDINAAYVNERSPFYKGKLIGNVLDKETNKLYQKK